jgi:starch synthase
VKIFFLSSEVAPFSKSGGLGDVSSSLPRALAQLGHQVTVVSPLYKTVPRASLTVKFRTQDFAFLSQQENSNLEFVFAQNDTLFARSHMYGASDDARRFFSFTQASLELAQHLQPDVIHCNDWQTAFAPYLVKTRIPTLHKTRLIFTIHNLAYQGNFSKFETENLGLAWADFTYDKFEFHNQLSFMKAGIQFADAVTTVSPSYAREILTPENGMGFHDVLSHRKNILHGILNGVDVNEWNPSTDMLLPAQFSSRDLSGKNGCRNALLKRFSLNDSLSSVFGIVGRMVEQKGVDLIQSVVPHFLEHGCKAVVLGTGEKQFENQWLKLQAQFPTQLSVTIGFDNALAHLIEAGSDFFLMPSRFEPCGLNQMYSMLYGAVPIVHEVGGLKDTVIDAVNENATGFTFSTPSADSFRKALVRAVDSFSQAVNYRRIQKNGMTRDFSWSKSAEKYVSLYKK